SPNFICIASRGEHRVLHSFPTRRSSDLRPGSTWSGSWLVDLDRAVLVFDRHAPDGTAGHVDAPEQQHRRHQDRGLDRREAEEDRSEEHTSELQSRENLVCRLLLEKKKKT